MVGCGVRKAVRSLPWMFRFARVRSLGLVGGLLAAFVLAGCGGPTDVTGQWGGTMDFEDSSGGLSSAELDLSLEQADNGDVRGTGTMTVRTPTEAEETELSEVAGRVREDGTVLIGGGGGDLLTTSSIELQGEAGGDTMDGSVRLSTGGTLDGLFSDAAPEQVTGTFELERE